MATVRREQAAEQHLEGRLCPLNVCTREKRELAPFRRALRRDRKEMRCPLLAATELFDDELVALGEDNIRRIFQREQNIRI
jgi:hypothetical protein